MNFCLPGFDENINEISQPDHGYAHQPQINPHKERKIDHKFT